jgi:acylphosphatase
MQKEKARAHVTIAGRVQGVFFRMETQRAANRYCISGWVKNNANGKVEAVFEGDKEKVLEMLKWCRQGSPMARVTGVDVTWETYEGAFGAFNITY